jgi:prophage DNA circulation protein
MVNPAYLQDGRLDDITLEMETIDDRFPKVIAEFKYPFMDGSDLEDMGQDTHLVTIRCFFWDAGETSHTTYDNHINLVNALAKKSDWTLFHPKYGEMKGKVRDVFVRHDDRIRHAEVDITFLEQMRGVIAAGPITDVEAAMEGNYLASVDEQYDELAEDMIGLGIDPELVIDPERTVLEQISGVSLPVREVAKEIDVYLAAFRATAGLVAQPTNSLVATITFLDTIPGVVLEAITKCVERVARLYDGNLDSPARYMASLDAALLSLGSSAAIFSNSKTKQAIRTRAVIAKHLAISSAQRLAMESAYCYAVDEQSRQAVRRAEKAKNFDIMGNYTAMPMPYIMNVRDLESSLATIRTRLQSGVDTARVMQSLKDMALELLRHVSGVKLERERIISIHSVNPLPLHLICLKYGLDYNCAERIVTINRDMFNPSFVQGDCWIYMPGAAS